MELVIPKANERELLARIKRDVVQAGIDLYSVSRKEIYDAELCFLQHLKNSGLNVQVPVKNKYGEYVSTLEDGTFASVLTWLKGKSATYDNLSINFCRQLGTTVAQMHRLSKSFSADNILKYDEDMCSTLMSQLDIANNKGYFKTEHFNILTAVCKIVKNFFSSSFNDFTVIHGDLSLSNTLITSFGISLIDFSLFGYGHPMIDAACAYSFIRDETMRHAFNDGYKSDGGIIDKNALNLCYAFNEIMGILLHIEKLATDNRFEVWLDKLCRNMFIPVINGEDILWTELNV